MNDRPKDLSRYENYIAVRFANTTPWAGNPNSTMDSPQGRKAGTPSPVRPLHWLFAGRSVVVLTFSPTAVERERMVARYGKHERGCPGARE
jgi:hypothetical protein